jgi:hypothetical protein
MQVEVQKLSTEETTVAQEMHKKGYRYILQFQRNGKIFETPKYFRYNEQITTFLKQTHAQILWRIPLEKIFNNMHSN